MGKKSIFEFEIDFERLKNVTVMKKNTRIVEVDLIASLLTWAED